MNAFSPQLARLALATAILQALACAQIAQDRPDLCGAKFGGVALPDNVRAVPSSVTFSELLLKPPGFKDKVSVQVEADDIREVCPVPGNRLLVFGHTSVGSYAVVVVDARTGQQIDWFRAYDPIASPDRHWLVSRAFYPAHFIEVPFSEEYLLYDLSKDAAGNRAPNTTVYTEDLHGRVIYPAVDQGLTFERYDLPANQLHVWWSNSFYWSDDSAVVVFADKVQGALSAVLVKIAPGGARAYVHPIIASEVCEQGARAAYADDAPWLTNAEIGASGENGRSIQLEFQFPGGITVAGCKPQKLFLQEQDFVAAPIETHVPKVRKGKLIQMQK